MILSAIFYCSLPIIIFLADILGTKFIKNEKVRKYVLITFYILFITFIVGCRAGYVGNDTPGYKAFYETRVPQTIGEVFTKSDSHGFEKGYVLLMFIFSKMHTPFLVFNIFVSLAFTIPMVLLTFRLSKVPSLSIVVYICFGLFTFNMSAIRQSIAIGLCLLGVYLLVLLSKKKWYWQVLTVIPVVIAYFFHKSAPMFLVFYVFIFISFNKKISAAYLLLVTILLVLFIPSFETIASSSFMKNGLSYSFAPPIESFKTGGTVFMLLAFMVIYIVSNTFNVEKLDLSLSGNKFFNKLNYFGVSHQEVEYEDKYAVALLLIFLFSYVLDLSFHLFARVGLYGATGFAILLPNVLLKFSKVKRLNPVIYLGVTALAILYFVFTTLRSNYLTLMPYGVF